MPYRIDIQLPSPRAADCLIELGALDIEVSDGRLAAIMPDGVTSDLVTAALNLPHAVISKALSRDNGSVWLLRPGTVHVGSLVFTSYTASASPDALRIIDSEIFGTGHHPTTALCLEALQEVLGLDPVDNVLDVGTGSGILALAALKLGVPRAVGLDVDSQALEIAAENARLNGYTHRLQLVLGGPGMVTGQWPLILANVLAAPLIDMAPTLVQRLSSRGRLILSGIPVSVEPDVRRAYEHLGLKHRESRTLGGWTVLVAQASW